LPKGKRLDFKVGKQALHGRRPAAEHPVNLSEAWRNPDKHGYCLVKSKEGQRLKAKRTLLIQEYKLNEPNERKRLLQDMAALPTVFVRVYVERPPKRRAAPTHTNQLTLFHE